MVTISWLDVAGLIAVGALTATIISIGWRLAERPVMRELLKNARGDGWLEGYDAAMCNVGLRPKEWGQDQG